jgi:ArsR family transcriptional regulator
MSQHLNIMYRSGILGKRRQGAQMFYRIADEKAVVVCRAMCSQVATETAVN